jgi:hypothetical protein
MFIFLNFIPRIYGLVRNREAPGKFFRSDAVSESPVGISERPEHVNENSPGVKIKKPGELPLTG